MGSLDNSIRDRILEVLFARLPADAWDVYLFGSFARGTAGRASDVDLAVQGPAPLPPAEAARIVADLEEQVPILRDFDLVDLATAPIALAERIRREGIRWNVTTCGRTAI
jgi:predicted nucleotidyltransferase